MFDNSIQPIRDKHTKFFYELITQGLTAYFSQQIEGAEEGKNRWELSVVDIIVFLEVANTIGAMKIAQLLLLYRGMGDSEEITREASKQLETFSKATATLFQKACEEDFLSEALKREFRATNGVA